MTDGHILRMQGSVPTSHLTNLLEQIVIYIKDTASGRNTKAHMVRVQPLGFLTFSDVVFGPHHGNQQRKRSTVRKACVLKSTA